MVLSLCVSADYLMTRQAHYVLLLCHCPKPIIIIHGPVTMHGLWTIANCQSSCQHLFPRHRYLQATFSIHSLCSWLQEMLTSRALWPGTVSHACVTIPSHNYGTNNVQSFVLCVWPFFLFLCYTHSNKMPTSHTACAWHDRMGTIPLANAIQHWHFEINHTQQYIRVSIRYIGPVRSRTNSIK